MNSSVSGSPSLNRSVMCNLSLCSWPAPSNHVRSLMPTVSTTSVSPSHFPTEYPNQAGWGRYLHFLSAWVCVLTGLVYALYGLSSQHFRNDLLPARADLSWTCLSRVVSNHLHLKLATAEAFASYNVLQRFTYLMVVFVLFPLMIWTGLAMSPAIISVFPVLG